MTIPAGKTSVAPFKKTFNRKQLRTRRLSSSRNPHAKGRAENSYVSCDFGSPATDDSYWVGMLQFQALPTIWGQYTSKSSLTRARLTNFQFRRAPRTPGSSMALPLQ
jgi:hypothetical protein